MYSSITDRIEQNNYGGTKEKRFRGLEYINSAPFSLSAGPVVVNSPAFCSNGSQGCSTAYKFGSASSTIASVDNMMRKEMVCATAVAYQQTQNK